VSGIAETHIASRRLEKRSADLVEGVVICVDEVSRNNLLASLAQPCSSVEVWSRL
jgi:hypothetical protein